jgi:class 3 adenylate cyclase/tetratricopeptide (TPR) repeat protein
MVCRQCGTTNPDGARFCLSCGARLEESRLEPYLPNDMLAKLEAAREGRAMEGERRIVTMLFCDVKGSTAMAENLDPEEWAEIMNGAFEHLIAPIYRYEGTLARLMGDAIFAFFGAPIAHEDDPQRAVNAGLEILDGIQAYRDKVRADRDLDLNVRVGINTGLVVVGQVGSDLRLEYTAMGDAVNVAARMEQTAEPGTVQVTGDTLRLVAPLFDVEPRGDVEVKGRVEPVPAYWVAGRKDRPGSLRGVGGRESPLVGRDRELDVLREAVAEVQDGRGRIVSLIAEAGLGKSRLIEETRRVWTERRPEDARLVGGAIHRIWETWQCVSYDTARPYAQYRRMLARIAGIVDTDPPDVVRRKLAATIEPGAEDWHWLEAHMRVWRSLFGVTEGDEEPLEGEAFRRAIMELVPGSTRRFGSADPRLLVFEDLHWCDEASMDLLIETAKLVDELPCLFLFAYRPDRRAPSWRLKQWLETEYPHRSAELTLPALTNEESGALVDELLPERDRLGGMRAQILERTEGNPLFVEEMAAAVLEQSSERGNDVAIPPTLQALITARLDALDEDTRRTLQLASVVGRSFAEPVLRAVSGNAGELVGRLRELERRGLIRETARTPQIEYAFHHSLTQEATYDTILLKDRRRLHLQVGDALEDLSANRVEEFAPVLVHHFREGGDDERTLRYATTAGDHAARLFANAEAVTHYTSAIEAAARLHRADEALDRLYLSRGRALELSGRYDDAAADYEEMQAVAEGVGNRAAVLEARMALTTLYATPTPKFDSERGRALAELALALARELGERIAESKALWNLMILNVYGGGDLREAVDVGRRSLAIAREMNAREQMAFTLNDLWRPLAAIGDLVAARASLDEARSIWRELGNLPMLSENLASSASLRRLGGEYREAVGLAEEAYATADRIGNPWGQAYSLLTSYGVHLEWGDVGKAMGMMKDCIALAERAGFLAPQAIARADLGSVYGSLGDVERGLELVQLALDVATKQIPMATPWVIGTRAELHLLAGQIDEAEATVTGTDVDLLPEPLRSADTILIALVRARIASDRGDHARAIEVVDGALGLLRRVGIRQYASQALLAKGRSLAKLGQRKEAAEVLREARSEAESLECRWVMWEILSELGQIMAEEGNAPDAAALRAEAHRIVDRIAKTIGEEELRSSFLARPDVLLVTSGPSRE